MNKKAYISEDHGLALLSDEDLKIYSPGISTGIEAEIRMAKLNPKRRIIAATNDETGANLARKHVLDLGMEDQIMVNNEDVSEPLPYKDNFFDFIYAHLVLHYLPKNNLEKALNELYRILKSKGKLYVVIRSTKCEEATTKADSYDPKTRLTTYFRLDKETGNLLRRERYFHTKESIRGFITSAGFHVSYSKSYDEKLHRYKGSTAGEISPVRNNVIELLAIKPSGN